MVKKVKIVLDEETYRLLETLAHSRVENKSSVVRGALWCFAEQEKTERVLGGILAQRHAREAMKAGIAARAVGRLVPHERVIQRIRRRASRSPRT